jgi:hypothetical protein
MTRGSRRRICRGWDISSLSGLLRSCGGNIITWGGRARPPQPAVFMMRYAEDHTTLHNKRWVIADPCRGHRRLILVVGSKLPRQGTQDCDSTNQFYPRAD